MPLLPAETENELVANCRGHCLGGPAGRVLGCRHGPSAEPQGASAGRQGNDRLWPRHRADFATAVQRMPRPEEARKRFRIDLHDRLIHGGDSGEPALVSGHSDRSRLIKFVAHLDPDTVMPPQGEPLSDRQIGLLRAWIDQGAKMPDRLPTGSAGVATAHWSFQPVKQVAPLR